jgi:CheY-like chemotaxis protein
MSLRNKPLILVVEDEFIVRDGTVLALEDAGFEVIAAGDAEEAFREFESHPEIAAVFSDINMPGRFDGLALARMIFDLCPTVQLILTSGRGAPGRDEMPAGTQFLAKPYQCAALQALIRAH